MDLDAQPAGDHPQRVKPRCPHFGVCGGCTTQDIAYPHQLHLKHARVASALRDALGASAPQVEPTIGLDDPWGFRHKAHYVVTTAGGRLTPGHYRGGSQDALAIDECPVHAPEADRAARAAIRALDGAGLPAASADGRVGIVRHAVARSNLAGTETQTTIVVTRNDRRLRRPLQGLASSTGAPDSLHLNLHDRPSSLLFGRETQKLHGRARLRVDVSGVSYLVSPTVFFQTNLRAAATLVRLVLEGLPADPRLPIVDLYAGAGLFALPLARRGHRVVAVEENGEAASDGEASLAFNRIGRRACQFRSARVETWLQREQRPAGSFGLVLDPPREGCSPEAIDEAFGRLRPGHALYVSCDPDALARDLRRIAGHGYRITRVQPVDMFPHTAHVETVVALDRVPRRESGTPAGRDMPR